MSSNEPMDLTFFLTRASVTFVSPEDTDATKLNVWPIGGPRIKVIESPNLLC